MLDIGLLCYRSKVVDIVYRPPLLIFTVCAFVLCVNFLKMSDGEKKRKEPYSPVDVSMEFSKLSKTSDARVFDTKSFTEMMINAVNEKSFQNAFIPVIQASIQTAFELYKKTIVDPLVETNNRLMDTVEKQQETITNQSKAIDEHKREIGANYKRINDIRMDINEMQQYSRRTSLRIFNLDVPNEIQDESQLTKHVVSFINDNILKKKSVTPKGIGASEDRDVEPQVEGEETSIKGRQRSLATSLLSVADIERCHPIGQGKKHILVKFVSYHVKSKVFSFKTNLKFHPRKVFITEDLTKYNHSLVQKLMIAKSRSDINSFWTFNGKIFAKYRAMDNPVRISSEYDIRGVSDHSGH